MFARIKVGLYLDARKGRPEVKISIRKDRKTVYLATGIVLDSEANWDAGAHRVVRHPLRNE